MWQEYFGINKELLEIAEEAEDHVREQFRKVEHIAELNQLKVIKAMQDNRVSEACFHGTTGYGYNDLGRDTIDAIFAQVFEAEDALVRTQFVSGTHALNTALWSVLRPGDLFVSVTGKPYDTLEEAIGLSGGGSGALMDFGVKYEEVPLLEGKKLDYNGIRKVLENNSVKMIYIQRSKGYGWRQSLSIEELRNVIYFIKQINWNVVCLVDNCYGEFVEDIEPSKIGADLIVGSLIKNPGGGIAPTGAYIAGNMEYVKLAANRLTSPGIGKECGSTQGINRYILMGLFLAPHVVCQSLKGAIFCSAIMKRLGYNVSPDIDEKRTDIIQAIKFNDKDTLIYFCQGIQKGAAVDSHVVPQPWDMPGYNNKVIMAAGTFVQGASIEVSADAPIRPPYIAYLQGGLTYTHAKLSILMAIQELINKGLLAVGY